jgi:hypothetical protein
MQRKGLTSNLKRRPYSVTTHFVFLLWEFFCSKFWDWHRSTRPKTVSLMSLCLRKFSAALRRSTPPLFRNSTCCTNTTGGRFKMWCATMTSQEIYRPFWIDCYLYFNWAIPILIRVQSYYTFEKIANSKNIFLTECNNGTTPKLYIWTQIIFMVELCILRSIDCLLPTNALNVNFI